MSKLRTTVDLPNLLCARSACQNSLAFSTNDFAWKKPNVARSSCIHGEMLMPPRYASTLPDRPLFPVIHRFTSDRPAYRVVCVSAKAATVSACCTLAGREDIETKASPLPTRWPLGVFHLLRARPGLAWSCQEELRQLRRGQKKRTTLMYVSVQPLPAYRFVDQLRSILSSSTYAIGASETLRTQLIGAVLHPLWVAELCASNSDS